VQISRATSPILSDLAAVRPNRVKRAREIPNTHIRKPHRALHFGERLRNITTRALADVDPEIGNVVHRRIPVIPPKQLS